MDRNISPTIKRLPSDVQTLIRSGNIITNASQCVTELVVNALDAKATKIAVRLNFNYHKIQVADNGCGMNSADLDLIGERFMTSKCHSLKDLKANLSHYGFRGEALASLKECSGVLTLESRPEGSDTTYAKVYVHGKIHSLGISRNSRPAYGTTVTVHDFMYNIPVRRGRMQPDFEIEEIKSSLQSVALIHPEVLRQLDEKFIVVVTMCEENKLPDCIVLFDQHASHERVRVEQLIQEYQEEESDTKFKTSAIDSAIILSLGEDDIQILQSFRNYFENLGIHFELLDESTLIQVSSVPTCLLMRETREDKSNGTFVLKTLLETLIREQIDFLVATRGCAVHVPQTLQEVINSEACKGALKFGDHLTTKECRLLLSNLSSCKAPFYCAHGRPSLIPVIELKHLYVHQKPIYKPPDLHKLKKILAE